MQPLSEHLAELSAQAKKAEDRVAKAQAETKERLGQQREEAHREAQAALKKVDERISQASEQTKSQFAQLKLKVDADFERMRENASARKSAFESWQANNYADDKLADAQAAIGYAIAGVKLAELATLEAIEAQGRAETKAERVQPIQA